MASESAKAAQAYTLYHNLGSVCSIMVRYTLAAAGPPKTPDLAMAVEEKAINLFAGEQLEEQFLTEVNPLGLVPVLASPAFDKPLPDSLHITFYIVGRYPQLYPVEHGDKIAELLGELHGLNLFSLSTSSRPGMAEKLLTNVDERLNGDISGHYREALEFKRQHTVENRANGVKPSEVEANEVNAQKLTQKLVELLSPDKKWFFGLDNPTALDTHVVIFIARMKDVERLDLVPKLLLQYFDAAAETEEYKSVMNGRKTMVSG